jgi:hypothetical protein
LIRGKKSEGVMKVRAAGGDDSTGVKASTVYLNIVVMP